MNLSTSTSTGLDSISPHFTEFSGEKNAKTEANSTREATPESEGTRVLHERKRRAGCLDDHRWMAAIGWRLSRVRYIFRRARRHNRRLESRAAAGGSFRERKVKRGRGSTPPPSPPPPPFPPPSFTLSRSLCPYFLFSFSFPAQA